LPGIKSLSRFLLPVTLPVVLATFLYGFFQPDDSIRYQGPGKPTTDFSFIRRFICISDLLGKEQWHENKGRSFDDEGIHLTNGKQHPVNACHYALFCYDEYISTGDTAYLNGFYAQVRYLMDPESYHEPDSGLVAYPYMITFHDLKPPWYSALAQSEAISVLVRYYALTRDEKALSLITRIRNFMIGPQEGGCGTMSVTAEGRRWYEEYPNSKQEKQVLNGFYLSIVALYEYSMLFPDDDSARFHYKEAIETAKASYKYYDTGTWLKYNRGDGRQISNGYLKWIILETKLLYQLTGDIYFKNVSMLLSSYSFNKSYEAPGSRLRDYDFSVPLDTISGEKLAFRGKAARIELSKKSGTLSTSFGGSDAELSKLYDAHIPTFSKFIIPKINQRAKDHLTWKFKERQLVGGCTLTFAGPD
jgi:hypothetical protein